MSAQEPALVNSLDASAWDAADGSLVDEFLDSGTSDDVQDSYLEDSTKAWVLFTWTAQQAFAYSGGDFLDISISSTAIRVTGVTWNAGGNPGTGFYRVDKNLTDGVTGTGIQKVGKSPDDIFRVEYLGLKNASVGDTITVHFSANHNVAIMACLPYSTAGGVTTTNKLTYTMSGGSPAVFTLTQAWIDDLTDIGGGRAALRLTEDGGISGDFFCSEIDADLVIVSGAVETPGVLATARRRASQSARLRMEQGVNHGPDLHSVIL